MNTESSYNFRVIAVNSAGDSVPAETELISMDTSDEVPTAPVSLSCDDISEDSVTLCWISPANSGLKPIVGYKIFKLEGNSSEWQLCGHIHRSKQLSYTITDLDYHCQYKFRVCAYSEMGLGKPNDTNKMPIKKPVGKWTGSFFGIVKLDIKYQKIIEILGLYFVIIKSS